MLQQFDVWELLAGLGIFLFGMFQLENALNELMGRSFKRFLKNLTDSPLKSVGAGVVTTALLQSSSVVSLMVLAFAGAGLLSTLSAIGIIMGSNLGTTFTGWVVANLGFKLNIASFALPMIAVGSLGMIAINPAAKLHQFARFLAGFGFLFLGLDFMKHSIGHLSDNLDLAGFENPGLWLFILIGIVLTVLLQSSSAVMVILLSALNSGIIDIYSAAAAVIGSNIGTTVTVTIGAVGGARIKKQIALSHFLFNLVTALIAVPLLKPVLNFFPDILNIHEPLNTLVFYHSFFNLTGILIFLPFLKPFSRWMEGRFTGSVHPVVKYLDQVNPKVPEAAVEALRLESLHLLEKILKMHTHCFELEWHRSEPVSIPTKLRETIGMKGDKVEETYREIRQIEEQLFTFLVRVQQAEIGEEDSNKLQMVAEAINKSVDASKTLRLLHRDLKEFQNSIEPFVSRRYRKLRLFQQEMTAEMESLIFSSEAREEKLESSLLEIRSRIQENYEKTLRKVYNEIAEKSAGETQVTRMLNANRQIYLFNRTVTDALAELLLSPNRVYAMKQLAD